jgi:hypothetical protein
MSRVLVVQEDSSDGIYLIRVDVTKLREAFVDTVDFEVFLEGIESGDSDVSFRFIDKDELKNTIKDSMQLEGYTTIEIEEEMAKF